MGLTAVMFGCWNMIHSHSGGQVDAEGEGGVNRTLDGAGRIAHF